MITSFAKQTLIVLCFSVAVFGQMPEQLRGEWCTKRWLKTSNVEALSKNEADAFIGRKLRFSPEMLESGDQTAPAPKYSVKRLSESDLIDQYMVTAKELGLTTKSVKEVDLEKNGRLLAVPGDTVFLKSGGKIIWYWKGVFFEAIRCSPAQK